jgi:hypothetical protein
MISARTVERLERCELLFLNDFGNAPRRAALRRTLSPDVNVLRLRPITAGHDDEDVFGLIGYGNDAVARQPEIGAAFDPLRKRLLG